MIARTRQVYICAAIVTILLGLGVRKFLPAAIGKDPGDVLYATMVYWILRVARPQGMALLAAFVATAVCFAIEFLKFWHAGWLDSLRATTAGHLVFGAVFSVANLICYSFGAALGWAIDRYALGHDGPQQ